MQSKNCWSSRGWKRGNSTKCILPPLCTLVFSLGAPPAPAQHWRGLCHEHQSHTPGHQPTDTPILNPNTETVSETHRFISFSPSTIIVFPLLDSHHTRSVGTQEERLPAHFWSAELQGMWQFPPLGSLFCSVLQQLCGFSLRHRLILIYIRTFPQHPEGGTPWGICCPSVIYTKPTLNSVTSTLFLFYHRQLSKNATN